jgi:spore germination protein YaaH
MKRIFAWLRTRTYPGPLSQILSSEASYTTYGDNLTDIMPFNGGELAADGTWTQQPSRTNTAFSQGLLSVARGKGHGYYPAILSDFDALPIVLASPALQETAAQNLADLALSGRWDSPWDGVYSDMERLPPENGDQMSDFLALIYQKLKAQDMSFGVSIRGRAADSGGDGDDAYSFDFNAVGASADFVDLRLYGFREPKVSVISRPIAPHWWIRDCIDYALLKGIPARKLFLGLGTFSGYYADSAVDSRVSVNYSDVLREAGDAGASIDWIERDNFGLVREPFINLDGSHMWAQNAKTMRDSLHIFDWYRNHGHDLGGVNVFIPGQEDPGIWHEIRQWNQSGVLQTGSATPIHGPNGIWTRG